MIKFRSGNQMNKPDLVKEACRPSVKDTNEDNIMIKTPYGKKRWWLIRDALELYELTRENTKPLNMERRY